MVSRSKGSEGKPFRSETSAKRKHMPCLSPLPHEREFGGKFPNPDTEIGPSGPRGGNATELGDVDGGPGEELIFLCKSSCPWNGSSGDRDAVLV
ncbi:hypothetical protein JTE90_007638 [Oedothorax gibbosus]|uniref:Uncharacterized protein n=1 Tax=Oedothorax gibbosus TaxID=931172 RepID=A0AAV6TLM5_9ARAC|nr:hypothetical protein JTE90_007638 [Oedothorax gibbosus]